MIYNKTDVEHWSSGVDDWSRFVDGDVVVGLDPQGRCGWRTYTVSQVFPDRGERVVQRGLFWEEEHAKWFAEELDEDDEVVPPESEDQYVLRSEVVMDGRPVDIPEGAREVEVEYQKTKKDRDGHLKAIVSFLEPVDD